MQSSRAMPTINKDRLDRALARRYACMVFMISPSSFFAGENRKRSENCVGKRGSIALWVENVTIGLQSAILGRYMEGEIFQPRSLAKARGAHVARDCSQPPCVSAGSHPTQDEGQEHVACDPHRDSSVAGGSALPAQCQ